jgi:hypothetical protein
MAASSRRNNAAQGLTGLLLFGGFRFYAILEGPQRRVFARMERIITDPRHRRLTVLREDAIEVPRFANWSFGFIPEGEQTSDRRIRWRASSLDRRRPRARLERRCLGLRIIYPPMH